MAVSISGTSGTWSHGTTGVSISGSGFGTKDHAAPVAWDDMSGTVNTPTAILTKWDGYWPSAASSARNMQYSTEFRSRPMPHSHTTQYMRGVHNGDGSSIGWNVAFWKTITIADGMAIWTRVYNYTDPSWVDGGSPLDGNYKEFGYSTAGSIYELPNNMYQSLWEKFVPPASSYEFIINDDSSGDGFSTSGNIFWDGGMITPAGNWRQYEVRIKVAIAGTNGKFHLYQNNVSKIRYNGYFDRYPGFGRSMGWGGYARASFDDNNVRFFADAYFDYEPGAEEVPRALLVNNATYANATIVEPQIISAWSDTSITLKVNLGKLADSGSAYLFVFNKDATVNATGHTVTLGGGASISIPVAMMGRAMQGMC